MGGLTQIAKIHIYVTSFSENGDLLSQWRGYCPKGSGVSIGFHFDKLKPVIESQNFYFAPCIYDQPLQHQIMRELIENVVNSFRSTLSINPDVPNVIEAQAGFFLGQFVFQAPILKHPTFSEEREWRAISRPTAINHPQAAFREGPFRLIPYFVLKLTSDPTEDIPIYEFIVGPNPQKELAWAAAAMLMGNQNIKSWGSRSSNIPYRGS